MNGRKIIGIVGMPGSGKSVFDNVAKDLGFTIIIMGDVVRAETIKQGLELTPENIGNVMISLREKDGAAVVAKRCIPRIKKSEKVIIDGIRSLAEVEVFRKTFPEFKLVHIHASPDARFRRIANRNRSDDSQDWLIFTERDRRELGIGIGSAIALADYIIVNEGTLSQFKVKVRNFLETTFE